MKVCRPYYDLENELLADGQNESAQQLTVQDVYEDSELAAFQEAMEREIAVALADFECIGKPEEVFRRIYGREAHPTGFAERASTRLARSCNSEIDVSEHNVRQGGNRRGH